MGRRPVPSAPASGAIHHGCRDTGDSGCEAYLAHARGVGLSHERSDITGAESLYSLEGNMCGMAATHLAIGKRLTSGRL